jgi:hypothetical protein
MSWYCLLYGSSCDGEPFALLNRLAVAALALDNATCCAFDAYQVTEADVIGGDVVAL